MLSTHTWDVLEWVHTSIDSDKCCHTHESNLWSVAWLTVQDVSKPVMKSQFFLFCFYKCLHDLKKRFLLHLTAWQRCFFFKLLRALQCCFYFCDGTNQWTFVLIGETHAEPQLTYPCSGLLFIWRLASMVDENTKGNISGTCHSPLVRASSLLEMTISALYV